MNDGPIFEWGPDMPIDDDVADDESSSDDDDVSVPSVPVVPLFLPQPVPPFPADDVSIHTTDADVSSADDTTFALDAPVTPVDDLLISADAAACVLLVPDAVLPDAVDAVIADPDPIDDVVADHPDDVFLDAVSAASADVNHEAQSL